MKKIYMTAVFMLIASKAYSADIRAYQFAGGAIKEISLDNLAKCSKVFHRKTDERVHSVFQKKSMNKLVKGYMKQSLTGKLVQSRKMTISKLKGHAGACSYGPKDEATLAGV